MPTEHIVALLITERDKLNRAIAALHGSAKGRSRPPNAVGQCHAVVTSEHFDPLLQKFYFLLTTCAAA